MNCNIKIDSQTRFVVMYTLSKRVEEINKLLKEAQALDVTSAVEFWQGELTKLNNTIESINKNTQYEYKY